MPLGHTPPLSEWDAVSSIMYVRCTEAEEAAIAERLQQEEQRRLQQQHEEQRRLWRLREAEVKATYQRAVEAETHRQQEARRAQKASPLVLPTCLALPPC